MYLLSFKIVGIYSFFIQHAMFLRVINQITYCLAYKFFTEFDINFKVKCTKIIPFDCLNSDIKSLHRKPRINFNLNINYK